MFNDTRAPGARVHVRWSPGKRMRKKRNFGLSRLKMAWLGLGLVLLAGAVFVWLSPEPVDEPDLVVDLPSEPERYAGAPQGVEQGLPVVMVEDEGAATGPKVITVPDDIEAGPTGVTRTSELITTEEEQPDGTLRITIPETSGEAAAAARRKMATAALPALVGSSEYGSAPKIGSDGLTPFNAYRRPSVSGRDPQVAVMLSGLGLDAELTEQAINRLPPEVALSFAPYSKDVTALMEKAMAAGHEVAIELPMEEPGVSAEALGPAGLTIARRGEANGKRLGWLLARAPAYPLATNYLGTSFGKDEAAISEVMSVLKSRGLGYIDDTGLGAQAAIEQGVPYGRVNVIVPRGSGLAEQGLSQLKASASSGRPVLARLYISADAIRAIETWADGLEKEGFDLVPASAVANGPS